MPAVTFSVSYTLAEYLIFVREHAVVVMAKQARAKSKRPRTKPSVFARVFIGAFAPAMFFVKKRRMPVCAFVIDEHQIQRTTAGGQFVLPWSEVIAVHRYSLGYLVEKNNGAMPLPYRCFSPEQASVVRQLLERRENELRLFESGAVT